MTLSPCALAVTLKLYAELVRSKLNNLGAGRFAPFAEREIREPGSLHGPAARARFRQGFAGPSEQGFADQGSAVTALEAARRGNSERSQQDLILIRIPKALDEEDAHIFLFDWPGRSMWRNNRRAATRGIVVAVERGHSSGEIKAGRDF